mmetsp:Transcript_9161/g.18166  ORF Transcript_9161/g.18166 Transcript_9161/m.18166 type:complete len:567 (+) Transcript_9161:146-1846(+)
MQSHGGWVESIEQGREEASAAWAVPGSRICIGRYMCTVRYVGSIEGQKGLWVGIEWDDVSRGKHDGTHQGKRYFSCRRQGDACATFVRYAKLREHDVAFGKSLEEAISERYKTVEPSVREVVGAEEAALTAQCDGSLTQAGLSGMMISGLAVTPLVKSFMRNVRSLDLSDNLISSWRDVVTLVSSLQNLKVLDLSKNMFDFTEIEGGPCNNLETLVLNNCVIENSKALEYIDAVFPKLKELYVYNNNVFSGVPTDVPGRTWTFSELDLVDIGGNTIQSWSTIAQSFGHLPNLRSLLVENNKIQSIDIQSMMDKGQFPSLEHLNVGGNCISNWESIQQLSCLRSLTELRFSRNPLCEDDTLRDRIQVIGRIKSLKWVNGSDISHAERRDSELAFLRRLDSFVPTKTNLDSLLESRIQYLENQYHVERNSSGRVGGPTSLGSGMIHIRLSCGSKLVEKRVPRSLTVNKLKMVVQKLTGVKAQDQVLILCRESDSSPASAEVISSEGTRELSFFSAVNGGDWHIRVEKGDTQSQLTLVSEQEARMQTQEEDMRAIRAEEKRLMKTRHDN